MDSNPSTTGSSQNKDKDTAAAPMPKAAAAADSSSDDGIHLEAVLVDEDQDVSTMKRSIGEESMRLKREMENENERLRTKMQEDNELLRREMEQIRTGSTSIPENDDNDEAAKKKKRCRIIWLVVIVVLIAGGVGAYFATSSSSKSEAAVAEDSSSAPTTPPVSTTEAPTDPPTPETPLFDPPTEEECAAIANGQTVQGQEETTVKNFDVKMDISLEYDTNLEMLLPDLQSKIQENIMTSLAGCSTGAVRHRNLQLYKYVVLNGKVTSLDEVVGETCQEGASQPCVRVVGKMDVYLQGEIELFRLLGKVIEEFAGRANNQNFSLVRKLGLDRPFSEIAIEGVLSNDPTEQPSPAPSMIPSALPTNNPTIAPTRSPTPVPTTGDPTAQPTPSPTKSPTLSPTAGDQCTDICDGNDACTGFDFEEFSMGCGSCNGDKSCLNAQADIGADACKNGGCEGVSGVIGDKSCIGKGACKDLVDVDIGENSCKCNGCCACIREGDVLPPGSCNAIAEDFDQIDYTPYENFGPVSRCCMAPPSGGGGGFGPQ
jgi:hypothetical protein